MKRNQFLSTAIRLLVETMFFYVLGAYAAIYKFENEKMFIDVDNAVVSVSSHDESNFIASIISTVDNVGIHTQIASLKAVMNVQHIYLNWKICDKLYSVKLTAINSTRENDYLLDKPPRGDWIQYNTS